MQSIRVVSSTFRAGLRKDFSLTPDSTVHRDIKMAAVSPTPSQLSALESEHVIILGAGASGLVILKHMY